MSRDDSRKWLSLRSAVSQDLKELEHSGVFNSKRGGGQVGGDWLYSSLADSKHKKTRY